MKELWQTARRPRAQRLRRSGQAVAIIYLDSPLIYVTFMRSLGTGLHRAQRQSSEQVGKMRIDGQCRPGTIPRSRAVYCATQSTISGYHVGVCPLTDLFLSQHAR